LRTLALVLFSADVFFSGFGLEGKSLIHPLFLSCLVLEKQTLGCLLDARPVHARDYDARLSFLEPTDNRNVSKPLTPLGLLKTGSILFVRLIEFFGAHVAWFVVRIGAIYAPTPANWCSKTMCLDNSAVNVGSLPAVGVGLAPARRPVRCACTPTCRPRSYRMAPMLTEANPANSVFHQRYGILPCILQVP
jgi:hypothetical protein